MSTENNLDQVENEVDEVADASQDSGDSGVSDAALDVETDAEGDSSADEAQSSEDGSDDVTNDVTNEVSDDVSDDGEDSTGDEGEIAADYLEELLDIADIDGDIEIEERDDRTYISILTEDETSRELESLVGRDGEVLEALQELTRLSALAGTSKRSRIVLDIAGHRVDRASKLHRIAEDAIEEVKSSGGRVTLKSMSAYERKVVHDAVAELGFHSESEGEGSNRHVVISAE